MPRGTLWLVDHYVAWRIPQVRCGGICHTLASITVNGFATCPPLLDIGTLLFYLLPGSLLGAEKFLAHCKLTLAT